MQCSLDRKHAVVILLGFVLLIPIGCGGPGQDDRQSKAAGSSQEAGADAKLTGPAAAVHAFLEGARRGNDEAVAAMLTPTARRKQAEYSFRVAPEASDTARFELGEVQIPNERIARVACRWIETDPRTDRSEAHEATYLLRKEPEGWRIAGVARIIFEGEPPLLLNYEDPEDMERQARMLKDEIARRAQAAQKPTTMSRSPNVAPRR